MFVCKQCKECLVKHDGEEIAVTVVYVVCPNPEECGVTLSDEDEPGEVANA